MGTLPLVGCVESPEKRGTAVWPDCEPAGRDVALDDAAVGAEAVALVAVVALVTGEVVGATGAAVHESANAAVSNPIVCRCMQRTIIKAGLRLGNQLGLF